MTMRPEEQAAASEIYSASKRDQMLKKGAKAVVGAGTAALTAKVVPFLSQYITPDIAIKGISKVSPQLGGFLRRGMEKGLDVKEDLNFIKNTISNSQEKPKQNKSVIQQYSDELDTFIKNHIQQGRQPLEAGALAQLDPKFKKVIAQMEKDHKAPFSAILESTYGSAQQPQQSTPQAQPNQAQGGNTDQALMAALEKILQM